VDARLHPAIPVTTEPAFDAAALLDAVVFIVGDRAVTRREVWQWAEGHDPTFRSRRALRDARAAAYGDDAALETAVEEAAVEFRYARGLEESDDLLRWLAARGLSVDAWWEAIRRDVLEGWVHMPALDLADDAGVEERAVADAETGGDADGDDSGHADTLEAGRLAELAVSDLLTASTNALARRMAVEREADWSAWRTSHVTDAALEQTVARERLAWIVLELELTRWSTSDAAREAVSCVQHDGMPLADVAAVGGAPHEKLALLLSAAPAALRDPLQGAAPGEVVGPVAAPPWWLVAVVRDKRPPTLSEPAVRAAAELDVEVRETAPLVARHIVWPGSDA